MENNYGCLILYFITPDQVEIRTWAEENINVNNLVEEGIEQTPHITVLYGFHDNVKVEDIQDVIKNYGPITVQLGKISRFEQEDHDILKIDVISESLEKLHYLLREAFKDQLTVTFPDYQPHVTLAHVKKGTHSELDNHCRFTNQKYQFLNVVYSDSEDKEKIKLDLLEENFSFNKFINEDINQRALSPDEVFLQPDLDDSITFIYFKNLDLFCYTIEQNITHGQLMKQIHEKGQFSIYPRDNKDEYQFLWQMLDQYMKENFGSEEGIPYPPSQYRFFLKENSRDILDGRLIDKSDNGQHISFWQIEKNVFPHLNEIFGLVKHVGFDPKETLYSVANYDNAMTYDEIIQQSKNKPDKSIEEIENIKQLHLMDPEEKKKFLSQSPKKGVQDYWDTQIGDSVVSTFQSFIKEGIFDDSGLSPDNLGWDTHDRVTFIYFPHLNLFVYDDSDFDTIHQNLIDEYSDNRFYPNNKEAIQEFYQIAKKEIDVNDIEKKYEIIHGRIAKLSEGTQHIAFWQDKQDVMPYLKQIVSFIKQIDYNYHINKIYFHFIDTKNGFTYKQLFSKESSQITKRSKEEQENIKALHLMAPEEKKKFLSQSPKKSVQDYWHNVIGDSKERRFHVKNVFINGKRQSCRVNGKSAKQAFTKCIYRFLHPDQRNDFSRHFHKAKKIGGYEIEDITIEDKPKDPEQLELNLEQGTHIDDLINTSFAVIYDEFIQRFEAQFDFTKRLYLLRSPEESKKVIQLFYDRILKDLYNLYKNDLTKGQKLTRLTTRIFMAEYGEMDLESYFKRITEYATIEQINNFILELMDYVEDHE